MWIKDSDVDVFAAIASQTGRKYSQQPRSDGVTAGKEPLD